MLFRSVNFIVAAVDGLQQLLQRVFLVVVVLAALVVVFWLATGSYLAYRTSERDKLITQVNQVVASLEATRDFERRFIVTRDKLELYGEINTNEKMVDLFPRLSALVPSKLTECAQILLQKGEGGRLLMVQMAGQ